MESIQPELGRRALRLIEFQSHVDERGKLTELDFSRLPSNPVRLFLVRNVPAGCSRGGHAHSYGCQILYCVSGEIEVRIRKEGEEQVFQLRPDGKALEIPSGHWSSQCYLEPESVLLVICSHTYDADSYRFDEG